MLENVELRCGVQHVDIIEHTNVKCHVFKLMVNLSTSCETYKLHVHRHYAIIEQSMPSVMWLQAYNGDPLLDHAIISTTYARPHNMGE